MGLIYPSHDFQHNRYYLISQIGTPREETLVNITNVLINFFKNCILDLAHCCTNCYSHFTIISFCGVGAVKVRVQVSRMEFYTDTVALRLDCSKISILYKKKIVIAIYLIPRPSRDN